MPKVVDREAKRLEIAVTILPLLFEKGIRNITVDEIAKLASIGKGTIYHYFESKEEIAGQAILAMHEQLYREVEAKFDQLQSVEERLRVLYEGFFKGQGESKECEQGMKLFMEFFSITIDEPNTIIRTQSKQMFERYFGYVERVIDSGIASGEILYPEAKKLTKGFCAAIDGLFIYSRIQPEMTFEKEFEEFFTHLMNLIKSWRPHETH